MRTAWNLTLGQERERFALRHTCEDCGHFDPAIERCRHEWPTAGHRRADYEAVAAAWAPALADPLLARSLEAALSERTQRESASASAQGDSSADQQWLQAYEQQTAQLDVVGLLEALRREKNLVRLIATPTALVGLVVSPGGERLVTADWLSALGLRIYTGQRSNLELRQLTRKLIAGKKTARARLEAVHRWVVENVEEVGELTVPATLTLSARKGSGMLLLKTMLREAGVRAELWIARDNFGADLKPDDAIQFLDLLRGHEGLPLCIHLCRC